MKMVTKETDRKTGEEEIIWKEGGRIYKRRSLERDENGILIKEF